MNDLEVLKEFVESLSTEERTILEKIVEDDTNASM